MKECYIAIGPFCWGRGTTQDEALKKCKSLAPRRGTFYYQPFRAIVMHVVGDDKAYVDDMGNLCRAMESTSTEVARFGNWFNQDTKKRETATRDIAIGDGATMGVGSDCYPFTVVSKTAKTVTIQRDKYEAAEGHDYFGEQKYTYSPDPAGSTLVVRMTKRGWRSGSSPITFGVRRHYSDPSF